MARTAADYVHDNNLDAKGGVDKDIDDFCSVAEIKNVRKFSRSDGQVRWAVIEPTGLSSRQRTRVKKLGFTYCRDWSDGNGGTVTGWGRL